MLDEAQGGDESHLPPSSRPFAQTAVITAKVGRHMLLRPFEKVAGEIGGPDGADGRYPASRRHRPERLSCTVCLANRLLGGARPARVKEGDRSIRPLSHSRLDAITKTGDADDVVLADQQVGLIEERLQTGAVAAPGRRLAVRVGVLDYAPGDIRGGSEQALNGRITRRVMLDPPADVQTPARSDSASMLASNSNPSMLS